MDGYSPGIVTDRLDANGKPVYLSSPTLAHVTSAATFNEWYNNVPGTNAMIVGDITLYDNGDGGYVNRFGPNGEQYMASVKTPDEQTAGTSLATCETNCEARARDAQPPFFEGMEHLRCNDLCQPIQLEGQQLESNQLNQANIRLEQAQMVDPPDEDLIAEIEAEIAGIEAEIAALEEEHATCLTDCAAELAERTAICTATCGPCSFNPEQWCVGGEFLALDGDPLFFPIDDAPGILDDTRGAAKIPAQIYQGIGWPWEAGGTLGGNAPTTSPMHNFHFTSEIAYWFKYVEGMAAEFTFIGDDDVFVYVNRRLLIDLGGIHVPLAGRFSIEANGRVNYSTWQPPDPGEGETADTPLENGMTTLADLGITDGGVYEIKVFHAERKPEGSSFQLTLSGFNAARSVCLPKCGDGIIAAGEQCDDGEENNVGGFNRCNANCTLGAFCGDGIAQKEYGEECDDNDPNKPEGCFGCRVIIFE
jgi:fibro-slime domain-containing protein